MSVRRRLLLWLFVSLFGTGSIFLVATFAVERLGIEYHQNNRLRRIALDIPSTLKSGDLRSINVKLFHGKDDFLLQIWRGNHEIYRSTVDGGLPRFATPGFSEQHVGRMSWKLYIRRVDDLTIQVSQSLDERNALARERAFHLMVPLVALIGIIMLCTPLAVSAGLKSLDRISDELDTRNLDRLIPLDQASEPAEVRPLVDAINTLLERLREAADSQQRFLAEASHELRTPLAGLQLQVQMAEQASDEATRQAALAALAASVKRASRMVEQLLATSRLDSDLCAPEPEITSLNALVHDALIRLEPIANEKSIDIGLVRNDEATIAATADEVLLLILNLIDNAIRYTPAGGRVDVSILTDTAQIRLSVEDSGPGIPLSDRPRAFDRFFRGRGNGATGSGLGLAIVKRIADRHQADLALGDSVSLGGLAITAGFPRSPG